jgi:hypothetical protein
MRVDHIFEGGTLLTMDPARSRWSAAASRTTGSGSADQPPGGR